MTVVRVTTVAVAAVATNRTVTVVAVVSTDYPDMVTKTSSYYRLPLFLITIY